MPNAEWGIKRICPTTGKRFYDLNKSPIVSPYTGEVVDIELAQRKMSVSALSRQRASEKEVMIVDDLADDDVLLDDDTATDLDDDLLEDDADETVSLDDLADVAADEEDL